MTELRVGDLVLTARSRGGTYQPIYAFAHHDNNTLATFLQIYTQGNPTQPLEISHQHLLFGVGKSHPVRADTIVPGDVLQIYMDVNHLLSNNHTSGALVTKVSNIDRHGLYAPLTTDGTLIVDEIATSCYASIQNDANEFLQLQGGISTMISQHLMIHLWLTPIRIFCLFRMSFSTDSGSICESYNRTTGMAHFVEFGFAISTFVDGQSLAMQLVILVLCLLLLSPLYALEYLVGAKMAAYILVSSGMVLFVGILNRRLARKSSLASVGSKGV